MSRSRSRGNRDTELALAKLLRAHQITGWRRQQTVRLSVERSAVRVRPDFVFPKQPLAIFVDGCFWHGCPKHSNPKRWLKKSSMGMAETTETPRQARGDKPGRRTGKVFWADKLRANIARDRFVTRTLRRQGWKVVRLWEHDLAKSPARCLRRIRHVLRRK